MFRGQSLPWTYRCRYLGYILNYNFHEILEFGKLQGFWSPLFLHPCCMCSSLCSEMLMTSPMNKNALQWLLMRKSGAHESLEMEIPFKRFFMKYLNLVSSNAFGLPYSDAPVCSRLVFWNAHDIPYEQERFAVTSHEKKWCPWESWNGNSLQEVLILGFEKWISSWKHVLLCLRRRDEQWSEVGNAWGQESACSSF